MRNRNFNDLDKAKRYVDVFLKVALSFNIVMAVFMVIAGIFLCVYDGASGAVYIIGGVVTCGFGIFMVFMIHSLLMAFVDGMYDIKYNGIVLDNMAKSDSAHVVAESVAKSYETCTNYFLYCTEKNAYLSSNAINAQGVSVVKDVLCALKFQSDDEAMRFADYKRLEIGEKWQIVKKELIIPLG